MKNGATAILFALFLAAGVPAQDPAAVTRSGVPVTHMWACPAPQPDRPGAGFPILTGAKHVTVHEATRATGGYNHHAQLIWHGGRFHAAWSNHPHEEGGSGQRVLYAWSVDAVTWSPFVELFPPAGPVKLSGESGLALISVSWRVINGRLCAVAGCYENIGFRSMDGKSVVPRRDRQHPFRLNKSRGYIAREVRADGSFSPCFRGGYRPLEGIAYEVLGSNDPAVRDIAVPFRRRPRPWPGPNPPAVDSGRLCEFTFYRAADDTVRLLARDETYSHRVYTSTYDEAAGAWPPAQPTDIPDSPSKSDAVRLDNGMILLIGNQMAPAFDNGDEHRHYQRDPLSIALSRDGRRFTQVFALRCGQQQWRVPRHEVRGRGGGAQYPCAIVRDGILYVLYSMGKEDMAISSVALTELGIK